MTLFLVLSYSILVLRSNSSAKSVVGGALGLNRNPSLWSRILCGTLPWNTRLGSQSILEWYVVLYFRIAMVKYLCHCFLYSPDAIFKEVLIVAWAYSRTLIVCACFVVACFKFMPNISATSCLTWETKTFLLSVIISVGK